MRNRSFLTVCLLTGSALAFACSSSDSSSPTTPDADGGTPDTGTTPGDNDSGVNPPAPGNLGFDVNKNGFAVENYANDAFGGVTNLTAEDMFTMFGAQACASGTGATCVLTPPAQMWADEQNKGMNGGHCEGLAALSLYMFAGKVPATDFGAPLAHDLSFQGNTKLQREVARWWATQTLEPTSPEISDTPSGIIDKLRASFTPGQSTDLYNIGIYKSPGRTEGHAITPIGLVDKGAGKVSVRVYDNNFPSVERLMEVDTTAQTWSYFASTDPTVPASEYTGTAETMTFTLTSQASRFKPQGCPFCGDRQPDGSVKNSLPNTQAFAMASGDGDSKVHVLFTSADGSAGRDANGNVVNTIAGATVQGVRSADLWKNDQEPILRLPVGKEYTATISGAAVTADESTEVDFVAPGFSLSVRDLMISANQVDTVKFSADGSSVTYDTDATDAATLELGYSADGADYLFKVATAAATGGQIITIRLDQTKGELHVEAKAKVGSAALAVTVEIDKIDATTVDFKHTGNAVTSGGALIFKYGAWAGQGQPMATCVDATDDGSCDGADVDATDDD